MIITDDGPWNDAQGLTLAYESSSGVVVHDGIMYIAGTRDLIDIMDDLRLPFSGARVSHRYRHADLMFDSTIKRVVGHSLGASVAEQLSHRYGVESVTYSGPFLHPPTLSKNRRFRNRFDPIASLDFSTRTGGSGSMLNPHGLPPGFL